MTERAMTTTDGFEVKLKIVDGAPIVAYRLPNGDTWFKSPYASAQKTIDAWKQGLIVGYGNMPIMTVEAGDDNIIFGQAVEGME